MTMDRNMKGRSSRVDVGRRHSSGKRRTRIRRLHQQNTVAWGSVATITTFLLLSLSFLPPHTTVVEGWSMFQCGSSRASSNREQSRSRHRHRHQPLSKNGGRLTRTLQYLSPQSFLARRPRQSTTSTSTTTTSRSSNTSSDDSNIIENLKILKTENSLLRETIRELQQENQQLMTKQQHQQQQLSSLAGPPSGAAGVQSQPPPKIVLETFEGERYIRQQQQQQQDNSHNNKKNGIKEIGDVGGTKDAFGLVESPGEASSPIPPPGITMSVEEQQIPSSSSSSSSSSYSSEEINVADSNELWCDDVLEDGTCPLEPAISFGEALRDRAYWLVGLLVMQSLSGIILASNEALLANHPEIVYYLTMMVGAGGNAGNQASVRGTYMFLTCLCLPAV